MAEREGSFPRCSLLAALSIAESLPGFAPADSLRAGKGDRGTTGTGGAKSDYSTLDPKVLAELDKLKYLWLDDPEFDGRSLKQFPRLPRLERLTLSSPRIRSYHLRYLDRFPNLRYLHLSDFTVSDKGMKYLAAALPNLEEIRGSAPQVAGSGGSRLDGVTERGLCYLQDLSHLKRVAGFVDGTVRAWVNSEERIAGKWSRSHDGRLSLRLLVPADRLVRSTPLWVIAELRNDSSSPITTLRPFAGLDEVRQRILVEGPSGPVIFVTPLCDTPDDCMSAITILPRQSVRDFLELAPGSFLGSDQAGMYRISYRYRVAPYGQPTRYVDADTIWQGTIQSETVTIRKE